MTNKKQLGLLIFIILILSIWASCVGIHNVNFSSSENNYNITTFRNQVIAIHGSGLYSSDSVSAAAQGIAQDYVTLFLGVPLLIFSYILMVKNSLKGKLLLTGTVGYFLYTYVSYTFLWMYNIFFLVYVILMSASLFTFILLIISIDMHELKQSFDEKLPVKFLGGFQIFFSIALAMMWLKKIVPTIFDGSIPDGLEHYTTLVIQGMDLGFIVPAAFLSGILLIKKNEWGYLLSSIIIMKGFILGAAITAMLIAQSMAGIALPIEEFIVFPGFCILLCICLHLLLKNIKEPEKI